MRLSRLLPHGICNDDVIHNFSIFHYRNSSFSFRTEHAFLSASATADTIAPLTFLALCGHCLTQRMQEIHLDESAASVPESIACTGHFFAHTPHFTQSLVALGTRSARRLSYRDNSRESALPYLRPYVISSPQTPPAALYPAHPVC